MKITYFFILMLIFFTLSCSTDENTEYDCIDSKLEELDMVEFTGQDVGCKFYLELYHYKNKQYFLLGSYCADIMSYPTDCNGNKLCENGEDLECRKFYDNATRVEIVGIEE